jgi:ABC-type transport system involved in multi-copper enzyme maturation permease subunit
MRQVAAIVRREMGGFFHSAMAPAVIAGFLVAVGLFFFSILAGYSEMSQLAIESPRSGNYMNIAEGLFRPLVGVTSYFLLFLMPALAMRLFSSEFRSGRFDLLTAWPVADHVWVLGKWLGTFLIALVLVALSSAFVGVVWFLGDPEPGPALTAVLGQLAVAGTIIAWGVFFSSLTRHQVAAYFLTFLWTTFLFILDPIGRFTPGTAGRWMQELSILNNFEKFTFGVLDTRNVLYFVLATLVPLLGATAVLAGRRLPPARRFGPWAPAVLGVALAVVVHLLGQSWSHSWDLTGNKRYSLAPQTRQVLEQLPANLAELRRETVAAGGSAAGLDRVEVLAFYENLDPAREITESLLRSCAQHAREFTYRILDPSTELDALTRFRVKASRTVVVRVGDRFTTLLQPEESALASALFRMSTGKLARVYHLMGHGEHFLDSDERSGYSSFGLVLEDQGYETFPLNLAANAGRVPPDADIVVIAGPRLDPLPAELEALEAHMARGGSILALFDPPTPPLWAAWMARWRVGLTGDVLIAVDRMNAPNGPRMIVVEDGYGDHEVSRTLRGMPTLFPMVQALAQVGEPDSTIAGAIILQSSDQVWGETDDMTRYTGRPSYDRETDSKGPLPMGMVLEVDRWADAPGPSRMVVIGNSEFLNNATINQLGNRDLLLNALGWLAREEGLIQIRGRDPLSQPIVLSDQAENVLRLFSIVGWPLFVSSLATAYMLLRRREKSDRS